MITSLTTVGTTLLTIAYFSYIHQVNLYANHSMLRFCTFYAQLLPPSLSLDLVMATSLLMLLFLTTRLVESK